MSSRHDKMLKLREKLRSIEEDRLHGEPDYSVEDVALMMEKAIIEVCHTGV